MELSLHFNFKSYFHLFFLWGCADQMQTRGEIVNCSYISSCRLIAKAKDWQEICFTTSIVTHQSETLIYTFRELPRVFPVNNLHHSHPAIKLAHYQATHANRKITNFPCSLSLVNVGIKFSKCQLDHQQTISHYSNLVLIPSSK